MVGTLASHKDGRTIANSNYPARKTPLYFYTRSNMRLSIGIEKVFTIYKRQDVKGGSIVFMEEHELKDILGKNIKFFRSQKHLSQADLAEKAGISITFLSNIERGNNFPLAGTLCSLAKTLKVEVFELFKGNLVPSDSKEVVSQLSKDIIEKMNLAVSDIFKQYLS